MEITEKRLEELKPYDNNPRKNDKAVEALVESIKEFGFRVPLIISNENVIISGHTRYKAAEELELEIVPCIVADKLTADEVKQFRIVDNKTQELAKWDFAALAEELESITTINMDAFGFAAFSDDNGEPVEITSSLNEGEEVDLDDFDDDQFDHECPECGFKWNE